RAEYECGVSGDHVAFDGLHGAHRSRPFPMEALPPSYLDDKIRAAIRELPVRLTTIPQAKNSATYDGRAACDGRSSCIPLCPIDAKYEARIHVERAQQKGVELRTKAVVVRLEVDSSGFITSVVYRDWDRREYGVSARIVVLAANGIENPKLLLN